MKYLNSSFIACALFSVASLCKAESSLFDLPIEELLKVKVTGSKLKTRSLSDFVAIKQIDKKDIRASGALTLEELLWRMPQVAGFSANNHSAYWGESEGTGASRVNLWGLGANRTLVLVNGRRLANGGIGANTSPDLNAIPLAIIERIEVLGNGASAIYGTDAVAGVVNIITQNHAGDSFMDLTVGQSEENDGETQSVNFVWRKHADWGDVEFYASRVAREAVEMSPRAQCGLREVNNQLVCYNSGSTYGGRGVLDDGSVVNFNEDLGGDGDFYQAYDPLTHNANVNAFFNTFNPITTQSVGLGGWYAMGELTLVFDFSLADVQTEQSASPDTIGRNRSIVIPESHTINPTGQNLVLQRRRLGEAGGRKFIQDRLHKDMLVGLEGNINTAWKWTSAFSWRTNTTDRVNTNFTNLDKVDNTLNESLCSYEPGAQVPCADYLGVGDVTSEVLDYILIEELNETGKNEQIEWSADITGSVAIDNKQPIALASGVVYRFTQGERMPDPLDTAGIANANPTAPLKGDYYATEAYTEAVWPFAKDLMAQGDQIELDAAVRYSDYEIFGSTTNYKLKILWEFKETLGIHLGGSTGFRAPSIDELFLLSDQEQLLIDDPCSNWSELPPESNVYQNCQQQNVPTNFEQRSLTIPTTVGGNLNLEPETSQTINIGIVLSPWSDLTAGVQFATTKIDDAVEIISGFTKLQECYNSPNLSNVFCSDEHIQRSPLTGDVEFLSAKKVNIAEETLNAISFSLKYDFNFEAWRGRFIWDASYTSDYKKTLYAGADPVNYAGKIISGSGSYTKLRSLMSFNLERNQWMLDYGLRHIGSAKDNTSQPGDIGHHVPAVNYHNLRLSYLFTNNASVYLSVRDLFNERAPFVAGWLDANTDTMTYDSTGRAFYLGAKYVFDD